MPTISDRTAASMRNITRELREPRDNRLERVSGPGLVRRHAPGGGAAGPGVPLPSAVPAPPAVTDPAGETVLDRLPFPSAGDPIRSEDFRSLSLALRALRDAARLSGVLLGQPFGQARLLLASQGYDVRVGITVFGSEVAGPEDGSLDDRLVLQVQSLDPGTPAVAVLLSEAVSSRRFTPNLLGLTYPEANERLRTVLGDVTFPTTPLDAPDLVGRTVAEAAGTLRDG